MTRNREALRLCFDALERIQDWLKDHHGIRLGSAEIDAIEAARTALVQSDENYQLRGEIRVLVGLLEAVLPIIKTVDGEDADECNQLMDLQNKIGYAILGASR